MKARLPEEYRGGQAAMMKQLQKVQEEMAKAQQTVEEGVFSASVGGGAVCAEVNGKHELLSVKLQPEVVDPEDVDMLEDLILAAVNEAIGKAEEAMSQSIAQAKGGLHLPGLS
ncbi:MAG: YbaB/EbfC family nucleoid-associated protein [Oscillospiraceae bacterium]|nr:YbaB/EbfC family nucleoid-associated protein [Oscillospiraceae bacterium]